MKKTIYSVILLFTSFFLFDTLEIDSNHKNALIYNKEDIHTENHYNVYFKKLNVYELDNILNQIDADVLSYTVENKKYYITHNPQTQLIEKYTKDKSIEDKIYYELNGFYIDSISLICETSELIKLEKLTSVF